MANLNSPGIPTYYNLRLRLLNERRFQHLHSIQPRSYIAYFKLQRERTTLNIILTNHERVGMVGFPSAQCHRPYIFMAEIAMVG